MQVKFTGSAKTQLLEYSGLALGDHPVGLMFTTPGQARCDEIPAYALALMIGIDSKGAEYHYQIVGLRCVTDQFGAREYDVPYDFLVKQRYQGNNGFRSGSQAVNYARLGTLSISVQNDLENAWMVHADFRSDFPGAHWRIP